MKSTWIYPAAIAGFLAAGILFCLQIEGDFDVAVIVIPSIIMMSVVLIAVITRNNPFLFIMMVVRLVVKLLATWTYTALPAFQLADVKGTYFDGAKQLAGSVAHLTDVFSLQQLWGTNLVIAIGACLVAVIGPSLAGAMVLFAIASFWGQFV